MSVRRSLSFTEAMPGRSGGRKMDPAQPSSGEKSKKKGTGEAATTGYDNGLLKQLGAVYKDLNVSSTPFSRVSGNAAGLSDGASNVTSPRAGFETEKMPDALFDAQAALKVAMQAEKVAKEARAKVDAMMQAARETKKVKTEGKNKSSAVHAVSKIKSKKRQQPASTSNDSSKTKRKRYTWSDSLHRKFMATIFDIGLRSAKPKLLLELLKPCPDELTTEHIKSHLQKYRANSKKTREMFYAQYEEAKAQALENHDGKALNPAFHAYPMPVGKFPAISNTRAKKNSADQPENVSSGPEEQAKTNKTNANEMWVWYPEKKMASSDGERKKNFKYQSEKMLKGGRNDIEPQPKWATSKSSRSNNGGETRLDLFKQIKQLEEQVEMHNAIQERHRLQQHHYDPSSTFNDGVTSGANSGNASDNAGVSSGDILALRRNSLDILSGDDYSFLSPLAGRGEEGSNQGVTGLVDTNGDDGYEDEILFKFLEE